MWNEIPGENKDWNKKIFEEIIAKHKFGEKKKFTNQAHEE